MSPPKIKGAVTLRKIVPKGDQHPFLRQIQDNVQDALNKLASQQSAAIDAAVAAVPAGVTNLDDVPDSTLRHALDVVAALPATGSSGSDVDSLSNLTVWLGTPISGAVNGGAIADWPDSSGSSNDPTQATGANQPLYETNQINGRDVVRFDGSNDYLLKSSFVASGYTQLTLAIAFKPLVDSPSRGVFAWQSVLGSTAPFIMFHTTGAGSVAVYVDGNYRWTVTHAAGTTRTYVLRWDGSTWSLWVDGVKQSDVVGGATNTTSSGLYFGNGYPGYANVDIGEFVLYNFAHSDADCADVVANALNFRWLGTGSDPAGIGAGVVGRLKYLSTDDKVYRDDGAAWKALVTEDAVVSNLGGAGVPTIGDAQIQSGRSLVGNGTSFPGSPVDGQLFYRTDQELLYAYDGGAATWRPLIGAGSAFPSSPTAGGVFYRTDRAFFYYYDATAAAWLSLNEYSIQLQPYKQLPNTVISAIGNDFFACSVPDTHNTGQVYLTGWSFSYYNAAAGAGGNYWTIQLSDSAHATISSFITGVTAGWNPANGLSISGTKLRTVANDKIWDLNVSAKTGTPPNINLLGAQVLYRLVG